MAEVPVESASSSPLTSKPGSESASESHVDSGSVDTLDSEAQSPVYLKSEEYRFLFRLPPDEMLIQDFNCAFQESILFQGHMYLFVRHICFYSNIFGFETKKIIHFSEVTCVRKAKTAAIFPNAIEVVTGGKKYFFASFLSRDEAYRLIVDGWSQFNNGTEVLIDHQDLKSEIINDDSGRERQTNDLPPPDRNKDVELSFSNNEDLATVSNSPLEQENRKNAESPIIVERFSSMEPFGWKVMDADPPTVPDYYTKVAESKFPVQIKEFLNFFISDKAINFIDTFHKRCGDKDFRCTSWSTHTEFGHTRKVSFQHPIKIYIGAKFGHCQEVQKVQVYRNSCLVIKTSQEINDVPYADYFRVEGLWVVERVGSETDNCCILRVYVNVAFSKKTMWKGKIEQSTIDECREVYSVWLNNAHELLNNIKKPEGETSDPNTNRSDAKSEEHERLVDGNNVMQIPLVTCDTNHVRPQLGNYLHGGLGVASFSASLFREPLAKFSCYLKSQNHLSLALVIAAVLILLMQSSIIVLLSRAPQVHLISQTDHINSIGSSRSDIAEAEAWLERRIHYLKDEMHMVEARLEKMRHEYESLKEHFIGLEQLRTARQ